MGKTGEGSGLSEGSGSIAQKGGGQGLMLASCTSPWVLTLRESQVSTKWGWGKERLQGIAGSSVLQSRQGHLLLQEQLVSERDECTLL